MKSLKPLLKYPGGKEKEIKYFRKYFPNDINHYYEPFLGGGAVYLDISAKSYFANDISTELIDFYTFIKSQNSLFMFQLEKINEAWKKLDKISDIYFDEIFDIYSNHREHFDVDSISNEIKAFIQLH